MRLLTIWLKGAQGNLQENGHDKAWPSKTKPHGRTVEGRAPSRPHGMKSKGKLEDGGTRFIASAITQAWVIYRPDDGHDRAWPSNTKPHCRTVEGRAPSRPRGIKNKGKLEDGGTRFIASADYTAPRISRYARYPA